MAFEDWFSDDYGSDYVPAEQVDYGGLDVLAGGTDANSWANILSDSSSDPSCWANILGDSSSDPGSWADYLTQFVDDSANTLAQSDSGLSGYFDGSGYDTAALDNLIAQYLVPGSSDAPLLQSPASEDFFAQGNFETTDPVVSDATQLMRLANPNEATLNASSAAFDEALSNPVAKSMLIQNPGVYGVSPDTGGSYETPADETPYYRIQNPGVYGVSPDTGGSYEQPKQSLWDKIMSPAEGQQTDARMAALYKALGLAIPKPKSNLAMGVQAALAAAQIAGALKGNKDTVTGPPVSQSGKQTKQMSWNKSIANKASGGSIRGAVRTPQGALGLLRGTQPGQADGVPIAASHGEYIFDADTVASLGDGNTEAGARKLDEMRKNIRTHKRSAPPTKIPPKAKSPEAYLKGAK